MEIAGMELWWWMLMGMIFMLVPIVEFRELDIAGTEPANRTIAGSVVGESAPLDFGTANNTAGSVLVGPKCIIFRSSNLQGNLTIGNMRFWLSANTALVGKNHYYCDITDIWTQNKTIAQVMAGTPGTIPTNVPSANVQKTGGGDITGIGHADTSQYIYVALQIGQDEIIGVKGGEGGGFGYSMKFDYS